MSRIVLLASLLAAALFSLTPTFAEPPPVRFEINFGAYVPRLDTNIRLDSTTGERGAEIDFEENLQLDDATVVPLVEFSWWIKKKHGLSLVGFDLSRSSTGQSSVSFRFGDQVFDEDVPLDVRFDTTVVALTYAYKLFNSRKRSFGINFGLNINQIDAVIATMEGPSASESGEATAPLPTLGVNGHVMLGKKWKFYGTLGVFGLQVGDYEGVLTGLQGGFIHETFKTVGFGVGVYGFNVRVDSENKEFRGRIEYSYNGFVAYLNLRFGGTATKARGGG